MTTVYRKETEVVREGIKLGTMSKRSFVSGGFGVSLPPTIEL